MTHIDINNYLLFDTYLKMYKPTCSKFVLIYLSIILLTYNIFPVPTKFILNIILFINNSNTLELKLYKCIDIINKYTKNWKYYLVFKFNFLRMIKKNIEASIIVIKFNDPLQLEFIFKKYHPQNKNIKSSAFTSEALIYNYDLKFNLVLLVKETNELNKQFVYYKAIQHLLIHWMQVVLNALSYTIYGKFNNVKIDINTSKLAKLYKVFWQRNRIINYIQYLLNGFLFLPWCANIVLNFEHLNLDLNTFKYEIENFDIFKERCFKNIDNEILMLLYIFVEICYLASLDNPADDRYWYVIEAIKENKS